MAQGPQLGQPRGAQSARGPAPATRGRATSAERCTPPMGDWASRSREHYCSPAWCIAEPAFSMAGAALPGILAAVAVVVVVVVVARSLGEWASEGGIGEVSPSELWCGGVQCPLHRCSASAEARSLRRVAALACATTRSSASMSCRWRSSWVLPAGAPPAPAGSSGHSPPPGEVALGTAAAAALRKAAGSPREWWCASSSSVVQGGVVKCPPSSTGTPSPGPSGLGAALAPAPALAAAEAVVSGVSSMCVTSRSKSSASSHAASSRSTQAPVGEGRAAAAAAC
mmetsp:Transcript_14663/g.39492  ORF Transcript_14663/g.39492 Transcript_14663/m.39492 type:complete len:283 (+) Transcript_14663:267-1115(+)